MSSSDGEQRCVCSCGQSAVTITGKPLFRMVCHCEICQQVFNGPYSDSVLIKSKDVDIPDNLDLDFHRYRPPPNVSRGKCPSCGNVVVEKFLLAPGMSYKLVPSRNFEDPSKLPEPAFHGFYHRRQADVDDDLPKYNGYWSSQLAFMRLLFSALVSR